MKSKLAAVLIAGLCLFCSAPAYEPDAHYTLTYVLMRLACFSHKEALLIASADEAIDDNGWRTGPKAFSHDNAKYHAMGPSNEVVQARKEELWQRALASKDLTQLGVFFHFQEDCYSHRHKVNGRWEPYQENFGHAEDLRQPDRIPNDPESAREMAREKLNRAKQFLKAMGREPSDFPEDGVSALIDAMQGAYRRSITGGWQEADANDAARALENACRLLFMGGKTRKIIHPPMREDQIEIKFDDNAQVTNPDDIRLQLGKIEDYNVSLTGPNLWPRPAPENGFVPPVTPPGKPTTGSATFHGDGKDGTTINLRSEVSIRFELVPTGETAPGPVEECDLICKGGHSSHAGCDTSCDKPCPNTHGATLKADYDWEPVNIRGLITQLDRDLPQQGGRSPAQELIDAALLDALRHYNQDEVKLSASHFAPACSITVRQYGYRKFKLKAIVTVTTTGGVEGKGTSTQTSTNIAEVATILQPDVSKPQYEKTTLNCKCEGKQTAIVPPGRTATSTTPSPGPQVTTPGKDPNDLPKVEFGGKNLNETGDPVTPGDQEVEIYIPGGTVLDPADPNTQKMVVLAGGKIMFRPKGKGGPLVWETTFAQIGRPLPGNALLISCIEMAKNPPKPSDVFRLSPERDPVLRKLALISELAFQHGPWEQARTWIYTDKAFLDKVNDRMLTGVTPGWYTKALYDIAKGAGIDLTKEPYRSLLEPKLAFGEHGTRESIRWFVRTQSELAPNDFAKEFRQGLAAFAGQIQPGKDVLIQHVVNLFDALDENLVPEVHRLAAELLKAIPEAQRGPIYARTARARVDRAAGAKKTGPASQTQGPKVL